MVKIKEKYIYILNSEIKEAKKDIQSCRNILNFDYINRILENGE